MPGLSKVTLLGDFTLDNQVTTKQKWRAWRETSMVEHLKALLPNDVFDLHDHSQGTYQANDILYDKFNLETESYQHIKQSDVIVVSMGATDLQYFLNHAFVALQDPEERGRFIKSEFPYLLGCMQQKQEVLIQKIREINSTARLVFMTHPCLASNQHTYDMQALGKVLNLGGPLYNPGDVMHEFMKQMYQPLFQRITDTNVMVLDVASSLNPYDSSNYAAQLEPSGVGGKKIAQMLQYMITSTAVLPSMVHRFCPDFFYEKAKSTAVVMSPLKTWTPLSPYDLRDGYSADEEVVYTQYDAGNKSIDALLVELHTACDNSATPAMAKAGMAVWQVVENKQKLLAPGEEKQLKMSVVLATHVIKHHTHEHAMLLERHAFCSAMGKQGPLCKILQSALLALVGTALLGAGFGALGTIAACGLMAAGAYGLFNNRMQGPAGATYDLVDVANATMQPVR
jgi:hypothetical protein